MDYQQRTENTKRVWDNWIRAIVGVSAAASIVGMFIYAVRTVDPRKEEAHCVGKMRPGYERTGLSEYSHKISLICGQDPSERTENFSYSVESERSLKDKVGKIFGKLVD